jgi:two-component system NtrC family response regulator
MARAVHALSPRARKAFVAINCAAIPETLLESELFGYEKGAFTGAVKQTPGKIETADGGTLFLDEIGDMPLSLQAKLLRFLQERVVERVGGREEIPVDVRVVCATNQDLDAGIRESRFRQDLYYRISEITIRLPPLREREAGKLVLARILLEKAAAQHGRRISGFSADAQHAIDKYHWPGNVRELENLVERWLALPDHDLRDLLGVSPARLRAVPTAPPEVPIVAGDSVDYREYMERCERQLLDWALARSGGNVSTAARLLQLPRSTLRSRLET